MGIAYLTNSTPPLIRRQLEGDEMRGLYYEPPCADMTIFNAFAVPFSTFTPRRYSGTEDTPSTSER
jgi:hypothetical protein